jgi:hypothetical protein
MLIVLKVKVRPAANAIHRARIKNVLSSSSSSTESVSESDPAVGREIQVTHARIKMVPITSLFVIF